LVDNGGRPASLRNHDGLTHCSPPSLCKSQSPRSSC
jgi:hypothetical protein